MWDAEHQPVVVPSSVRLPHHRHPHRSLPLTAVGNRESRVEGCGGDGKRAAVNERAVGAAAGAAGAGVVEESAGGRRRDRRRADAGADKQRDVGGRVDGGGRDGDGRGQGAEQRGRGRGNGQRRGSVGDDSCRAVKKGIVWCVLVCGMCMGLQGEDPRGKKTSSALSQTSAPNTRTQPRAPYRHPIRPQPAPAPSCCRLQAPRGRSTPPQRRRRHSL